MAVRITLRIAQKIVRCAECSMWEASPHLLRKGKYERMQARSPQAREAAEMLAIQALAFIAEDPERLAGFLAATGLEAAAIRDAARQPGFLAGVLEHMLSDESLLLAFADSAGIDPASIARARGAFGRRWERDLP